MTSMREPYLLAGELAVELLRNPAVATSWPAESALARLSVGGLAAHLASQIVFVDRTVDDPEQPPEAATVLEHYARVEWIAADLDADANVQIRDAGEAGAVDGASAVVARATESLQRLRERLAVEPADRIVRPPARKWGLRLNDFLLTRMMEIVVHSDDLACSVAVATPEFPPSVVEPVVDLLTRLSVRRHGATAVIRALSRAERAPATISAL
jgi:hypothetical protein